MNLWNNEVRDVWLWAVESGAGTGIWLGQGNGTAVWVCAAAERRVVAHVGELPA